MPERASVTSWSGTDPREESRARAVRDLNRATGQLSTAAMARMARHAERELRGWLYGPDAGAPAELAGALRAAAAEVEDRFGVSVELVSVGSCPLDERARVARGTGDEHPSHAAHPRPPRRSRRAAARRPRR